MNYKRNDRDFEKISKFSWDTLFFATLIPAYPRGQAVTPRSTWSLPKSMSIDGISLSKFGISERLKQSPSFKNVLSPSMKNSLKTMTDSVSSLTEQVKQSPSIRHRLKI